MSKLLVVDDQLAKLANICNAKIVREPHFHVVAYPGSEVITGVVREVESADRIACNYSIKHPDRQVHVKHCTGRWCR